MPFAYQRPPDLGAALSALGEDGALPIAGGTSLVLRLRRRELSPSLLVGVSQLPELAGIRLDTDTLSIGAATTLASVARSPEVLTAAPLLAQLCERARSAQIRNAATLGGAILSGPDFAEPVLALIALGARVELRWQGGEREADVGNLLADGVGLRPGELIVSVRLPRATGNARFGAHRVARREGIEAPLVAAAVALRLGANGVAEDARICLGVATARPLRLRSVEQSLVGTMPLPEAARLAVEAGLAEIPLRPDVRAGEGYRRRIIPTIVARSVEAALDQALDRQALGNQALDKRSR